MMNIDSSLQNYGQVVPKEDTVRTIVYKWNNNLSTDHNRLKYMLQMSKHKSRCFQSYGQHNISKENYTSKPSNCYNLNYCSRKEIHHNYRHELLSVQASYRQALLQAKRLLLLTSSNNRPLFINRRIIVNDISDISYNRCPVTICSCYGYSHINNLINAIFICLYLICAVTLCDLNTFHF